MTVVEDMDTETATLTPAPAHSALVVRSNRLLPALAKLDLMELRLIAFCISHIKLDDDSFGFIEARSLDIANIFEIPSDRVYGLIKDLIKRINQKPAEFEDKGDDVISFWFTTLRYSKGNGSFKFKFNDDLKEYLLSLRDNFTAYRLKDVYQFRAASTWHIYEFIHQHKGLKSISVELDKFKALTGMSGLYPRFNNFKYRILDPAIAEINAYSDIEIQYDLIKKGIKVEKIKFFIAKNTKNMTTTEKIKMSLPQTKSNHLPELAKTLRTGYKVCPSQAKQIANLAYHNDREKELNELLPKLKQKFDRLEKPKTTLGGYVFRTLKDELTRGKLVVAPDPEAEAEATR